MSMGVKSMDLESLVGNVIQTTSNVGGDVGLALPLVINDAPFRGLTAGPNITLTILGDSSVEIQAAADSTTASNLGGGAGVFAQIIAGDIQFKSLIAGTDISITSTPTEITINNIRPPEVGNRKLFSVERQISVFPEENNNLGLVMVGAGNFTDEGELNEMFDVDGYYIEFRVTTDMGAGDAGIINTDSVRRDLNFDITMKFRVPAVLDRRFWAGLFTDDPKNDDNPIEEHIALRLSTEASNVNFVISHADGVTQAETQLAVADTAIHTIRIVADEANSKFQYSFDGAALADLTTNIPAATTDLDIFEEVYAQAGGTLPHFDFWWLDGRADA